MCVYNNLPSDLYATAINALQPPQQSSSLLMALTFIAATTLVSSVVVETLDLFDDAEAKKGEKTKKAKKGCDRCRDD